MTSETSRKEIVIIDPGGGIIGCTTAYFLTRHPLFSPQRHSVTLLEASKIAGGASGKSGGLLALWAYPSNLVPLSYRLHAELAKEHDGENRWGYRRIGCGQLEAKGRPLVSEHKKSTNGTNGNENQSVSLQKRSAAALEMMNAAGLPKDLDWVAAESVVGYEAMGAPKSTAQVHPYQFTTSMASLAEEAGAKLVIGAQVKNIRSSSSASGENTVTYLDTADNTTKTIAATDIVVAAGAWTQRLIPKAPISGLRAHSVTIRPSRPVSAYALFTSIDLPRNFSRSGEPKRERRFGSQTVTPEIYARPNNEVYACGEGDTLVPLPETTADVETVDERCQDIIDHVGSVSDELRDGEVTVRQACYLPVCEDGGGPWIGKTKMKGVVMAAGHSCWGIQNAPATGKLVSEIVMNGKTTSASLGALDASRIM